MKLLSFRHSLTIAAGSLLAIVSVAAIAQAATDTIYKYSTPKNGSFSISPLAMAPDVPGIEYSIHWNSGTLKTATTTGCFNAGINLPQGATMTGLKTFWTSSGGGQGATFYIYRYTLTTGIADIVSLGSVVDDSDTRKAFKANINAGTEAVNNNQYAYGFALCTGNPNNQFHGATLSYTYNNAGD